VDLRAPGMGVLTTSLQRPCLRRQIRIQTRYRLSCGQGDNIETSEWVNCYLHSKRVDEL